MGGHRRAAVTVYPPAPNPVMAAGAGQAVAPDSDRPGRRRQARLLPRFRTVIPGPGCSCSAECLKRAWSRTTKDAGQQQVLGASESAVRVCRPGLPSESVRRATRRSTSLAAHPETRMLQRYTTWRIVEGMAVAPSTGTRVQPPPDSYSVASPHDEQDALRHPWGWVQ